MIPRQRSRYGHGSTAGARMRGAATALALLAPAAFAQPGGNARAVARGAPSARDVVLASADAIGGVEKLRALRGVRVDEIGGEYLVTTLTRGDAPARLIAQTVATWRSGADSALRRTLVQRLPMRAEPIAGTLVVHRDVAAVVRGPGLVPASAFDFMTAREELLLSPERVLLTALDAPDLRLLPDTVLGGIRHHVVSLGVDGAPVRVFIDAASDVPTRVALVRAYPTNVFWAMWGDLTCVTTWSAWALESDGIWYPRQRTVTLNGSRFREYVVTKLALDVPTEADSIAIPDSVRSAFATRVAVERDAAERGAPPRITPVALSHGVVLYQGGYQSTAVRQRDGVVIVEAPESNAKSRAVLADVAARWPGVPVKAVVTTSPMWMHMGGLREYAVRGIPIHALDVNVAVVRGLLTAPHAQAPDSLARVRRAPMVRAVVRRTTIGTGDERLELVPARGQHASSMMLVWFPGPRLLYASDVVVPDAFEPVFSAAYRAELRRIVRRERLAVDRMFAEHLPATPWDARRSSSVTSKAPRTPNVR